MDNLLKEINSRISTLEHEIKLLGQLKEFYSKDLEKVSSPNECFPEPENVFAYDFTHLQNHIELDREFTPEEKKAILYLRDFTSSKHALFDLILKLSKHDLICTYVKEHKKQVKNEGFGKYGKIKYPSYNSYHSGITWSDTSQGGDFWQRVFM